MKRFNNKIIYETLKEIVAPEHTALVVWDVQNALVNNIYNKKESISNLKAVIHTAREKGSSQVYLRNSVFLQVQGMPQTRVFILLW